MLVYPELTKDDFEELNALVDPIEKFFTEGSKYLFYKKSLDICFVAVINVYNVLVDSKKIDVDAKIPDETLQQVKDLGLFGQQIPHVYGR